MNLLSHYLGGIWYQGLFFIVVIIMEFLGFMTTAITITLAVAYLYRPSLLQNLISEDYEREFSNDQIQNRSDCLIRSRNILLVGCSVEAQVSIVSFFPVFFFGFF
jgi:hypothetical protein